MSLSGFATDAAGNIYAAGQLRNPVTVAPGTVLTAQAGDDAYVAKYSSTGRLLWARQLTGSGNERIVQLATDAAGNVYLAGVYSAGNLQMGTLSLPATAYTSAYVASFDTQGQPRWLREVSNDGANVNSLGLDATGNLYISGAFAHGATVGGIALNAPGTISLFVAKFDASGVAQWAQLGGSIPFGPTSVTIRTHTLTVSPAGDVYLGWTINPNAGGFGSVPAAAGYGDYDASVVRFNTQGVAQWQKRYGTAFADNAGAPALDGSGHLLVPVTFSGSGPATVSTQTLTGTGQNYGALLQLDATTGNLQWVQKLEASGNVYFQAVAADAAGNSYVAGTLAGTAQAGNQSLSSNGPATDALVASYSATGVPRWFQTSNGPQAEAANFIALAASNELAVGGTFYGQGQFGSTALTNGTSSGYNPFVARLGATAAATQAPQAVPMGFYPNPATDYVRLPGLAVGTRVQLLDALGRVAREATTSAAAQLSVLGLAPGLYTLRATDARGQQFSARLAVE